MIPQLSTAFARNAVGVSGILGAYYYTYSLTSLVAGLVLDRAGAKYAVSFGAAILGIGCLTFTIESTTYGYIGRDHPLHLPAPFIWLHEVFRPGLSLPPLG